MNLEQFKNLFDNCEIVGDKIVVTTNIRTVLDFIKETYHFELLKDITAIDCCGLGIELRYRLFNIVDNEELIVSYTVKDEAESVSSVFDSAVADEKEIFDLFGIKFIGNEELKRLYMPDSWVGYPLKKDYVENDVRLNWNDKT